MRLRVALVVVTAAGLAACGEEGSPGAQPGDTDTLPATVPIAESSSSTTSATIDIPSTPAPTTSTVAATVAMTTQSTAATLPPLPVDADELQRMTLQLADVPAGATLGDDSRCEIPLGSEGTSDGWRALIQEAESLGAPVSSCFAQLEFGDGSSFVHSLVVALPTEQAAMQAATSDLITDIVAYFGIGCCSEQPLAALMPLADLGSDGWGATALDRSLVLRAWRNGNTVGIVVVHGGGIDSTGEADRLAATQHARMSRTG
jgi:hypothetical protein